MTFGMNKTKIFLAFIAVAFSAVLTISTNAQSGSSQVSGTVTDQQGAIVAGATVKLINDEKGFSRTAVSNSNGTFTFTSVIQDTYRVEVEAAGFKKLSFFSEIDLTYGTISA